MRSYALIDTTGTILPGDLAHMVEAANTLVQVLTDAWDLAPISGVAISKSQWDAYVAESDSSKRGAIIPDVDMQFRFVSNDPNVPGALGFHDEQSGTPYAELLIDAILQNGGGVLDGGSSNVSLASVFFHELAESACDEYVSSWILMPSGKFIALESADPVEGNLTQVQTSDGTQVYLSDFVYPRYFDAQAPADGSVRFNYLETVGAPFSLGSGGYQIIFDPTQINSPNGPVSNVFGDAMPPWKKAFKIAKARNRIRATSSLTPPKLRNPDTGYCHCGWKLVKGACSKPADADAPPKPHVIVIPPPPSPPEPDPVIEAASEPIALPPVDETDISPAARMFMTDSEISASQHNLPHSPDSKSSLGLPEREGDDLPHDPDNASTPDAIANAALPDTLPKPDHEPESEPPPG